MSRKREKMKNRIFWTSTLATNVGALLLAIAVATNHWATRETEKLEANEGIFKKCCRQKLDGLYLCAEMNFPDFCTLSNFAEEHEYQKCKHLIIKVPSKVNIDSGYP